MSQVADSGSWCLQLPIHVESFRSGYVCIVVMETQLMMYPFQHLNKHCTLSCICLHRVPAVQMHQTFQCKSTLVSVSCTGLCNHFNMTVLRLQQNLHIAIMLPGFTQLLL